MEQSKPVPGNMISANSIGISEVANTQEKQGISTRSKAITKTSRGNLGQAADDNGSDSVSYSSLF